MSCYFSEARGESGTLQSAVFLVKKETKVSLRDLPPLPLAASFEVNEVGDCADQTFSSVVFSKVPQFADRAASIPRSLLMLRLVLVLVAALTTRALVLGPVAPRAVAPFGRTPAVVAQLGGRRQVKAVAKKAKVAKPAAKKPAARPAAKKPAYVAKPKITKPKVAKKKLAPKKKFVPKKKAAVKKSAPREGSNPIAAAFVTLPWLLVFASYAASAA